MGKTTNKRGSGVKKLDPCRDRLDHVAPRLLELVYRRSIEKFETLVTKKSQKSIHRP